MPDYIEELNESQRAAVLYGDGPSLVIAGAGSGKTRVLTYKIAYLLENGYNPWNILALTFTNKAAREMKERIARQVGEQRARFLWMGTFHSGFSRILRAEASHIGFTSQLTRRPISPAVCRHASPMRRTTWCLLRDTQPTRRRTRAILPQRCLPYGISTAATGSVAGRPEQWISMICWSIPISFSATFPTCWHAIASSSAMCLSTSIKTPTMHSTASCCN